MKLKTALLAACASALLTLPAQASLNLTITSTVTFIAGTDPFGFGGSTWTFQFNSSQTNYVETLGIASVITDSASLTVSGATNPAYNGTFAIADTNTTNFASLPNSSGDLYVGLNAVGSAAAFTFGPAASVSGFFLLGTAQSNPGSTDLIELSDWQGASVSNTLDINGDVFVFGPGIVNAVPEPSTYAALAGLAVLGVVALRHRK